MTTKVVAERYDAEQDNAPIYRVKRQDHYEGVGIVEDEEELVKVLVKLFVKRRIKVCFTASDGLKAVELVKRSAPRPKVILMDYRLLNMNGIETMKAILEVDPEIRYVFLSADSGAEDEALKAGAAAFLKKPATTSAIMAAVSRTLA